MRPSVLGLAAAALVLLACDAGPQPAGTGTVRLALVPASADVAGIQYTVSCDDGSVWSEYVELEAEGLPEHVSADHAGWPFADLFFVTAASTCIVEATPMASPTEASVDCAPASVEVDVTPDETTEVLLVISCVAEGSGADVVTLINHAPAVDKVTVTPGLEADLCKEVRVTPTVSDADGDAVLLTFVLEPPAGGVAADETVSATDLAFTPATPGEWTVTLTAADPWTSTDVKLTVKVLEGDPVCTP